MLVLPLVLRMNNSANSFEVKLKYNDVFALIGPKTEKLNKKIDGKHPKLSSICKIGKGMETAADKVFLFDSFPTEFPVEFVKKRVTGENMDRYIIFDDDIYVLYYEDVVMNTPELTIPHPRIQERPFIQELLNQLTINN